MVRGRSVAGIVPGDSFTVVQRIATKSRNGVKQKEFMDEEV